MGFYHWITIVLPVCLHVVLGSECLFPREWRGDWHEGRRIHISDDTFSHKGVCKENKGNKYLMLNKDSSNRKCFICLAFTQWHPNLLQYKASNCLYERNFERVCGSILGDVILRTLVRTPSSPQPCPFQGSYTFSYTNGTINECDTPISEVRACADNSRFKFVFKHCQGVRGTFDTTSDFQCLATWENGDKYLYGSFSQPWMRSVDEYKYRCFMHSFYGTSGDMAMSADPTCQGLQSAYLGVVNMRFTKDLNEPRGRCTFPDVLVNRNKWRDLSGTWHLEVEPGSSVKVLRLKERSPKGLVRYAEVAESSPTKLVIKCVEKTHEAESLKGAVLQTGYLTYTTDDNCESGYQCIRLVQRDINILELHIGDRLSPSKSQCEDHHFDNAQKHLLIPDVNDAGQCSITRKGKFTYQDKASDCTGTVNIGCRRPNEIIIDTTCPSHKASIRHEAKVEIYQCLHSWTVEQNTYIIVQGSGAKAKCLTFIDTEFGVELQSDDSCQSDRWSVTSKHINYLLSSPPDTCARVSNTDIHVQSDDNNHNRPNTNSLNHNDISAASQIFLYTQTILAGLSIYCLILHVR